MTNIEKKKLRETQSKVNKRTRRSTKQLHSIVTGQVWAPIKSMKPSEPAVICDGLGNPVDDSTKHEEPIVGVPNYVIKDFSERFTESIKDVIENVFVDAVRTEVRVAVEKSMAPYERQNIEKTIGDAVTSAMAPYDSALRSLIVGE